jgi:hypothetical protein
MSLHARYNRYGDAKRHELSSKTSLRQDDFRRCGEASLFDWPMCRTWRHAIFKRHGAASLLHLNSNVMSPPDESKDSGVGSRCNTKYIAAHKIQTFWRGTSLHGDYQKCIAARDIQTLWRATLIHRSFVSFMAARRIQTMQGFRGGRICICRSSPNNEFCSAEHTDNVARKIDQPELQIFKSARKVQTMCRCAALSRRYRMYLRARQMQTAW